MCRRVSCVVLYEEEGEWVAHCLEFDLVGCAATREAALELLSEAIFAQWKPLDRTKTWQIC